MKLTELATFDVVREELAWPWLAFDPRGKRFAFADSPSSVASRLLNDAGIVEGPRFSLPGDVALAQLRGFAIHPEGALLAACADLGSAGAVVVTCETSRELRRSSMQALAEGFAPRGVTFNRTGSRLWISAESSSETAVLLVDARSHAVLGMSRSPAFPRPSSHELYVHQEDDAILLVAACGEEGTFARVVGWSGDAVERIPTALDEGGVPAGFVGFSADAMRVHLVEADELRTHAWPTLHELSSVELADDFVSGFAGAVLGEHVYVDGQNGDDATDAVMRFDRPAIRGVVLPPPVPAGMWAGRLGRDVVVTVEPKGDPARGRVLRVALPDSSN